jgi:general secretion pathway protein G
MKSLKKKDGFTLIELLIVVAIIGILAAIAVPNFLNAQTRAKISRIMADCKAYGTALEMYILDNNKVLWDVPCPSGDHGWASCYTRLTTPISYMNRVLPDVFQAEDIERPASYYIGGKMSYDYGTIYLNGAPGKPAPNWKPYFGNSLWKIGSCGPDKAYTNVLDRNFRSPPYDSSNGLISAGDIYYTQQNFLNH